MKNINTRKALIYKAMSDLCSKRYELYKKQKGTESFLIEDDLCSVKNSKGRTPTFSAICVECDDGLFRTVNLEVLKGLKWKEFCKCEEDGEKSVFDVLIDRYPSDGKSMGAGTTSISLSTTCFELAGKKLGWDSDEVAEVQAAAKEQGIR